jgi:hypothetical protein
MAACAHDRRPSGTIIRVSKSSGSTARRVTLPQPTDRLPLGRSGLTVSPFCLGQVRDPATVLAAFDAGINFFFVTADMHWPLYEPLRRGLVQLLRRGRDIRDRIVIAAVAYATQPEFCWLPFFEVVAAIPGVKRLDVTVAGGAYGYELHRRLPLYRAHVRSKHVSARATGVSFHDRKAARHAVKTSAIDIAFVRYNAGHPGARTEVYPHLSLRHRTLLFGFTSTDGFVAPRRVRQLGLTDDFWRPAITDHYRFALTPPQVNGVLCSPETPRHVAALWRAVEQGPLDADEERYLVHLASLDRGRAVLTP